MENQQQNKNVGTWFKTSITVRMLMVGFLILILLVPLFFVQNLIRERAENQQSVIEEVNEKWGNQLLFSGPILKIPYLVYTETTKFDQLTKTSIVEKTAHTKYAYFFPEKLKIDTDVNAIPKKYGIYETSVYTAKLSVNGQFGNPDFKLKEIPEENILWNKASIILKTSNVKGIKSDANITVDGTPYELSPRYEDAQKDETAVYATNLKQYTLETPILNETLSLKDNKATFNMQLTVNGSERINFIPIGKETAVTMKSNWPHPSFTGDFMTEENSEKFVNNKGFNVSWKVYQINRRFEQQFFDYLPDLSESAFGVNLLVPVDEYQKSERSTKYGLMVIALTFLVFFLIQSISGIYIHPFQYLMIGLALTMFYTLLISISEHQNFNKAYVIAGIAVVTLITLYSRSVLKGVKFPAFILASLTALYTFIFVIIQLEDYALLVGSIGLFLILATVMFFSRKIDWNQG